MISYWESINWIEISIQYEGDYDLECVPLGWSGSGSVIRDHLKGMHPWFLGTVVQNFHLNNVEYFNQDSNNRAAC